METLHLMAGRPRPSAKAVSNFAILGGPYKVYDNSDEFTHDYSQYPNRQLQDKKSQLGELEFHMNEERQRVRVMRS